MRGRLLLIVYLLEAAQYEGLRLNISQQPLFEAERTIKFILMVAHTIYLVI